MWPQKHDICDVSDLFKKTFPYNEIIVKMELEPNKLKYITNHGIVTYVQGILTVVVRDAE